MGGDGEEVADKVLGGGEEGGIDLIFHNYD